MTSSFNAQRQARGSQLLAEQNRLSSLRDRELLEQRELEIKAEKGRRALAQREEDALQCWEETSRAEALLLEIEQETEALAASEGELHRCEQRRRVKSSRSQELGQERGRR